MKQSNQWRQNQHSLMSKQWLDLLTLQHGLESCFSAPNDGQSSDESINVKSWHGVKVCSKKKKKKKKRDWSSRLQVVARGTKTQYEKAATYDSKLYHTCCTVMVTLAHRRLCMSVLVNKYHFQSGILECGAASRQLTTNRCSQTSAFQLSWRSQNREVVGLTWLFISRGKLTEDFFPGNHFLAGIKAALHLTRLNLSNMWCLYCPMKKHSNTTLTDTVYMKHEMWNTLHLQPLAPLYMKSTVSGYITGFYRFIPIY